MHLSSSWTTASIARSNASPAPGTIPSAIAARLELIALSKASLRLFISDPDVFAGELTQPLFQLVAVIVARGLVDLQAKLLLRASIKLLLPSPPMTFVFSLSATIR